MPMTCTRACAYRAVPADVKAEASRAARALLAGCARQPPDQAAQLHAVLSQASRPLPLLPGDAAALLHTLATGEAMSAASCMCMVATMDSETLLCVHRQPTSRLATRGTVGRDSRASADVELRQGRGDEGRRAAVRFRPAVCCWPLLRCENEAVRTRLNCSYISSHASAGNL